MVEWRQAKGEAEKGVGGKRGQNTTPPPTRRSRRRQREVQPASVAGAEVSEEKEPEGAEEGEEEDGDTPRGGPVEV